MNPSLLVLTMKAQTQGQVRREREEWPLPSHTSEGPRTAHAPRTGHLIERLETMTVAVLW